MTTQDDIHISQLSPAVRAILAKSFLRRDEVRETASGDPDYSFALLDALEEELVQEFRERLAVTQADAREV